MSNWGIRRTATARSARHAGPRASVISDASSRRPNRGSSRGQRASRRVIFTSVVVATTASISLALGAGAVTAAEPQTGVTAGTIGTGISATSVSLSDDGGITYSGTWRQISAPQANGFAAVSNQDGSALIRFTGTQVSWIGRTSPASGKTDVLLDDVKVAVIDEYSATETFGVTMYTSPVLTDGPHKLKVRSSGVKNSASTGTAVTVDSFQVTTTGTATSTPSTPQPQTTSTAPTEPTPTGSAVSATVSQVTDSGISLVWSPVTVSPTYYAVARSTDGGPVIPITTVSSTVTTYDDISVIPGKSSSYVVIALDSAKTEIGRSATVSGTARRIDSLTGYRMSACPAATVTVSSAAELKSALSNVTAGETIRLNPGTYVGSFSVSGSGTSAAPIWICGPRTAIVGGETNNAFNIENRHDVNISGLTVRGSMRAVQVVNSQRIVVSDLMVESTAQEAIHFRNQTSDSEILYNTIHDTGTATAAYGEGIYLGTSDANWCKYNGCLPDQTTRIRVIGNTIYGTGAQPIEVKAGTSDGVIAGNTITGTTAASGTDWIKVKGNGWLVADNVGTDSPTYGYSTNGSVPGWGMNNIFTRNSATNTASFGVWIHLPNKVDLGNRVSCLMAGTGNGSGATNVSCVK